MRRLLPSRRRLIALGIELVATILILRLIRAGIAPGGRIIEPAAGRRVPDWFRRFVTERFDPAVVRLGLIGGARSPWGFVEHVGRKSGTLRRTPILPVIVGDHALIPLPYGRDAHWVRNVVAAGHCRIQVHERVYEVDEPQIMPAGDVPELPEWRKRARRRRPREYLCMRIFREVPGRLEDVTAADVPTAEGAATAARPVAQGAEERLTPALAALSAAGWGAQRAFR